MSASRIRKCLSKQHYDMLVNEFKIDSLPRKEKIRGLSLMTGLSYVTIKTWFRNMRYKLKSYSTKTVDEVNSEIAYTISQSVAGSNLL